MEKILKNLEPSVRAYLGDAFCFSIINDVAFDSGWVYDKYIHIEYTPCDGQIKYADYDYYDFVPDQGVFIKSFIEYPYEYCNQEIICNQIIGMIDNDEYCFALWDETVITNHLFGENQDKIYEHGCFVYGYDTEKKVFLTQGYFNNEKWEHYSIPYHVFYQAISYCPEKGEIALIGYKVRTDYEWRLDYDKVRNGLKLYKKNSFSKADRNVFDLNSVVNFFSNLYPGIPVHDPSLYLQDYDLYMNYIREDSILELSYRKQDIEGSEYSGDFRKSPGEECIRINKWKQGIYDIWVNNYTANIDFMDGKPVVFVKTEDMQKTILISYKKTDSKDLNWWHILRIDTRLKIGYIINKMKKEYSYS